ncbi:MAG: hypothetical protein ACFFEN_15005 [Candidatus Thorarchaeota archaeon]
MTLADILQLPHFYVMLIAIIFLTISIVLVTIHKPKKWYHLHVIFATIGVILTIIGVLLLKSLILIIVHGILGLLLISLLVVGLIGGIIARKLKKKNIRSLHLWLNRIIYIIVLIADIFGIIVLI